MNIQGLGRELDKHTGARSPARYVRLRVGRARRNADTVARWDLADADAAGIAAELFEQVGNACSKGDAAWAEVMETGGKSPIATIAIPVAEVVEGGEGGGGDVGSFAGLAEVDGLPGLLAVTMGAVVQTNGQLASMLTAERQRSQDILIRHIDSTARATAAETLLTWIEKNGLPGQGDSDGMDKALELLAPTLGPALMAVVSRLTSPAAAKPGDAPPPVESPREKADRLLIEITTVPGDVWLEDGRRERVELILSGVAQAMEEGRRARARAA